MILPYFPLGNLSDQHQKSRITEDEAVRLLHQGLTGIKYLHENGVVHRDIAPGNILIKSRGPSERPDLFGIVLSDFGLAKRNSLMRTRCGTYIYVAKEVFFEGSYSPEVDVWSLGVVVLELEYGLPGAALSPRTKGEKQNINSSMGDWCRAIGDRANDWDYEGGDKMMTLLAEQMLKVEVKERATAKTCLDVGVELGLWTKEKSHNQRTPTATRSGHDDSVRGIDLTPISKKASSNLPLDDDVSSGFYDIASDLTEVSPSRRQDWEPVQYYQRASERLLEKSRQGLAQVLDPSVEEVPMPPTCKRRRQQTSDSSLEAKGEPKRSRAIVSCEAVEDREPLSNQNTQDNVRALLVKNTTSRSKETAKVRRS